MVLLVTKGHRYSQEATELLALLAGAKGATSNKRASLLARSYWELLALLAGANSATSNKGHRYSQEATGNSWPY